jgi:hypothetical protein
LKVEHLRVLPVAEDDGGRRPEDLGRADLLPVDDFGIREGYRVAAGLAEQPKPKALW